MPRPSDSSHRGSPRLGRRLPALHALLFLAAVSSVSFVRSETPAPRPPPVAPPVPPPPAERPAPASATRPGTHAFPENPYSIGNPTDEEQLYVEYINRARADPTAEGLRLSRSNDPDVIDAYEFFRVDLGLMESQFAAIAAAPPVSLNARLTEAARRHSQDMFRNAFQGHDGTDGTSSDQRVTAAGYVWTTVAENVYSYAHSVWHGHAGFNVDWGNGPGGMQTPPGHRNTIHSPRFHEVGVGVVLGTNGTVGPQLVTQEFASRANLSPFVTGVVFYDFDGDRFYDLGEGIGGVVVRVAGTQAYAITARSGGYSVPVTGNGTYQVTFQVPGLADVHRTVTVSGGANVKVDHSPVYAAPVLGGSSVALVGRDNPYVFSPVGAATAYQWRWSSRAPWTGAEGAEAGLGRFEADASPGYDPIATDVRQSGSASFHLVHPSPPRSQFLRLRRPIRLGTSSQLSFWSRLGWASPNQVARVQVSTDGGSTWEDLWSQPGTDGRGETTFTRRQVSLAAFAGRTLDLRFAYTIATGNFFPQTDNGVGWYLDDIQVSEAEEITDGPATPTEAGNSFRFRPPSTGGYLLQVRPLIGDRTLNWGPALSVNAEPGGPVPPRLRIDTLSRSADGRWELRFVLEEGSATNFEVHAAPNVSGPWVRDTSAVIEPVAPDGSYRATLPVGSAASRFLRVVVP